HGLRLFQLGHQRGTIAHQFTRFDQIFRTLDERQRHPFHTEVQRELEVLAVFLGQNRDRQHGVWNVDTLAVGQRATGHDARAQAALVVGIDDLQAQLAIVQQQRLTGLDSLEQFGVRQADALYRAGRGVAIERELGARYQHDLAFGKRPDAQLGALQVCQDGNRAAYHALYFADGFVTNSVVFLSAVAEIEAEHIGPSLEQCQ